MARLQAADIREGGPPEPEMPDGGTQEPLQAGCCWTEREPGTRETRRCEAPTVPGKPWCRHHWHRFRRGQLLHGKTVRLPAD